MRLTLKAINDELSRRGHKARLEKGDEYFYFHTGEAADWLDRTVRVLTLSSLTLDGWMGEFQRLQALNSQSCALSRQAAGPNRPGCRSRKKAS